MNNKLREALIEHLTQKGNYDSNVDDIQIDILLDNLEFAKELKAQIKREGLIVTISNGNGIATTKQNPAFGTYDRVTSIIFQCCVKLGINRKDRIMLKLIEEKNKDDFDQDFN